MLLIQMCATCQQILVHVVSLSASGTMTRMCASVSLSLMVAVKAMGTDSLQNRSVRPSVSTMTPSCLMATVPRKHKLVRLLHF